MTSRYIQVNKQNYFILIVVSTTEWVWNRRGKYVKEWAQQMFTKICVQLLGSDKKKFKKKPVSHWFAGWVYANVCEGLLYSPQLHFGE